MNNKEIKYPLRISRYLYLKNICSRREADRLISEGQILINGKKAVLGQKINLNDKIEILKKGKEKIKNKKIIILNKPIGYLSHKTGNNQKTASSLIHLKEKLSPVGRLDKNSRGLLILSNDGRLVDKILNPKFEHEKEYLVKVDKKINKSFIKRMSEGVNIEGYFTKKTKVWKITDKSFKIILTEGKKHQIRRMVAALGYKVIDLKRLRVMNLKLKNLKEGEWREIKGKELDDFLKQIYKNEEKN